MLLNIKKYLIIGALAISLIIGLFTITKLEGCHDNHLIAISDKDRAKVSAIVDSTLRQDSNVNLRINKRDSSVSQVVHHRDSIRGRLLPLHATISEGVTQLPTEEKEGLKTALRALDSLTDLDQVIIDSLKQDTADLKHDNRSLIIAIHQINSDDSLYHSKYNKAIEDLHIAKTHQLELVGIGAGIGLIVYLAIHLL